jgi:hypothetical protein
LAAGDKQSPELLMQTYGAYYSGKGIRIAFSENGERVYSNMTEIGEISEILLLTARSAACAIL